MKKLLISVILVVSVFSACVVSATEGFLLLFLILAFCWILWKIIKGVL